MAVLHLSFKYMTLVLCHSRLIKTSSLALTPASSKGPSPKRRLLSWYIDPKKGSLKSTVSGCKGKNHVGFMSCAVAGCQLDMSFVLNACVTWHGCEAEMVLERLIEAATLSFLVECTATQAGARHSFLILAQFSGNMSFSRVYTTLLTPSNK